ncbi:hypothetical protein IFM89_002171 [Coptis chinensis]|uniref:U1-type domain-containing protein n=1 Tax=Coptis chinensis TaxID=261450 RepID=A0A835I4S2_9MAGN|nr:hypothetical protein IFM89_002171 [Coptis chinensis]
MFSEIEISHTWHMHDTWSVTKTLNQPPHFFISKHGRRKEKRMVWFQCEDCGENLKKPKLANHFRMCSANKLSCIDCGQTFGQQSVQSHTQCITEAEKYGPKGQVKASNDTPAKINSNSNKKPDVDINVGLSTRPPWFCSLCNTTTTSKQTLLLHAEGKKHRAKARAFHASKQKDEVTSITKDSTGDLPKEESICNKGEEESKEHHFSKSTVKHTEEQNGNKPLEKKRKAVDSEDGSSRKKEVGRHSDDSSNGEVFQAKRTKKVDPEALAKKKEHPDSPEEEKMDLTGGAKEVNNKKIKWKKLISSFLRSNPDGALKMRKLQKLVLMSLQESGHNDDEDQLKEKLMAKINSSSKFVFDDKRVHLAVKS